MFTPIQTAAGAILLHQATSALLFVNGRILGVSSILGLTLRSPWTAIEQLPVLFGVCASAIAVKLLKPEWLPAYALEQGSTGTIANIALGGLLIGWSTKNARGCTSGHMLCGLSRLSPRSTLATALFFLFAVTTASLRPNTALLKASCGSTPPCYTLAPLPEPAELVSLAALVLGAITANWTLHALVGPTTTPLKATRAAVGVLAGVEFGLGLLVSGMADPGKVLSFFSVRNPEYFDPSLALVFFFGVIPNILLVQLRGLGGQPRLAKSFSVPTLTLKDTDWRFVVGAATFGVAWGLQGVCPGPGVVRAALQPAWGLVWMAAFAVGYNVLP